MINDAVIKMRVEMYREASRKARENIAKTATLMSADGMLLEVLRIIELERAATTLIMNDEFDLSKAVTKNLEGA